MKDLVASSYGQPPCANFETYQTNHAQTADEIEYTIQRDQGRIRHKPTAAEPNTKTLPTAIGLRL